MLITGYRIKHIAGITGLHIVIGRRFKSKNIMAENTKIEWCNHTVNLWWGCSKVHTGCKNCYAESLAKLYGDSVWGIDRNRKLIKSAFPTLAFRFLEL